MNKENESALIGFSVMAVCVLIGRVSGKRSGYTKGRKEGERIFYKNLVEKVIETNGK